MEKIRKHLLAWYKTKKRELPWRNTTDPYPIWISEIMLQQTRVTTVIPYYHRFLTQFPSLDKLANAPEQEVLKSWEGLGYYSRARNLHAAAKEVVADYGSELPNTRKDLQKLPGFGPYTSAAVASIAFNEPVACVDGNVRRVISRIFATHDQIDDTAQALLDPNDPADFNQAMMELGALICLPKNPKCDKCPVEIHCEAKKKNLIANFPRALGKTQVKFLYASSFLIRNGSEVFVVQRPQKGRYAGFWEFPTVETSKPVQPSDQIPQFGLEISNMKRLGTFRHQLTHRTIHVTAFAASLNSTSVPKLGTWMEVTKLRDLPFSKLQQRVACLGRDFRILH